jgi:hypothetical protein
LEYCGALLIAPEIVGKVIGEKRADAVKNWLVSVSNRLTREYLWDALLGPFGKVLTVLFVVFGICTLIFNLAISFSLIRALREAIDSGSLVGYKRYALLLIDKTDLWFYCVSLPMFAPAIFFFGGSKGISLMRSQTVDINSPTIIDDAAFEIIVTAVKVGPRATILAVLCTSVLKLIFLLGMLVGRITVEILLRPTTAAFRGLAMLIEPSRLNRILASVGLLMLTLVLILKWRAE